MCLKHYTRVLYDLWCIFHHHHHHMCTVHWVDLLPPTFNATLHSLHPYDALSYPFPRLHDFLSPSLTLLCSMDALKCSRPFIVGRAFVGGACALQDDNKAERLWDVMIRWEAAGWEVAGAREWQQPNRNRERAPLLVYPASVYRRLPRRRRLWMCGAARHLININGICDFIFSCHFIYLFIHNLAPPIILEWI